MCMSDVLNIETLKLRGVVCMIGVQKNIFAEQIVPPQTHAIGRASVYTFWKTKQLQTTFSVLTAFLALK